MSPDGKYSTIQNNDNYWYIRTKLPHYFIQSGQTNVPNIWVGPLTVTLLVIFKTWIIKNNIMIHNKQFKLIMK